jgi:hypothetical protein
MKVLYFDCFAGVSGDMFLGALLDLGVPEEHLRAELGKLNLPGYSLTVRKLVKQNITATKFDCVEAASIRPPQHRGYTQIAGLIHVSGLPARVKERALGVFRRIGEAEAKIHGVPLEEIHFHEVGAVDSIVDIVGACIAIEQLGVDVIQASPLPLGSGFVETAHGRFPIPAPATLELLQGVPTVPTNLRVELVTPTGAALVAEFAQKFGPLPALTVEQIGYGAGSRDLENSPNMVRAILGEAGESAETDVVNVIETNLDDMNPEFFGDLMERLLAGGAWDVFWTPVQMKKHRPGTLVTVLGERNVTDRLVEVLLTHTTSFGVRIHQAYRRKLAREIVTVPTRYGSVAVKVGRLGGRILQRAPEYESCKTAAAAAGVPVREVYNAAVVAAGELK